MLLPSLLRLLFFVVICSEIIRTNDALRAVNDGVLNRIDCHPEPGASANSCTQRRCTWDSTHNNVDGIPYCYFVDSTGYTLDKDDVTLNPAANNYNPYYPSIPIKLQANTLDSVLNVKLYVDGRYEPYIEFPREVEKSSERLIFQNNTLGPGGTFAFTVMRSSDGTNLWDTSIGGLLFGDQYIQIATYLPSKNIYGFGDNIHRNLRHNMDRYTNWPMFTRDAAPDSYSALSTRNIYGVHPFYMVVEDSGKAHGVLILNSNAQASENEVVLGPAPHLVYRTIGGNIDLYFFPGPKPDDVIRQYHIFIGKPFLPAYWGFGFQLSRWSYPSYGDMVNAVNRTRTAGVPLDMVVADIDYMERYKIFTLGWTELPKFVTELHNDGIRLTIIIDPGVQVNYKTFERAMEKGARFVEWPSAEHVQPVNALYPLTNNTLLMLGNVWPDNNTAMPDFMDPSGNTTKWWIEEFRLFHEQLAYDSLWIDMNEPSNFDTDPISSSKEVDQQYRLKCPIDGEAAKYDNPKYQTHAAYGFGENNYLFTKTECLMGKVAAGNHRLYDTHSLYGTWMAIQTQKAQEEVLKTRGAMISRSTFPSAGHYTGHWLGDNSANWEDMQTSVIGSIEFNMFGMTFVGADICGFFQNTEEELCLRWQQMGAFYPFSRNHNSEGNIAQDPGVWPEVAAAARQALLFKYYYLPYLYTLFYQSTMNGGAVIRPLFFEFPNDISTYDISFQFLWGSGMMIIPVLFKGSTTVDAYIPPAVTWYSLRDDDDYGTALAKEPTTKTFSAKTTELIPVLAKGGVILTRQAPAQVLRDARKNPFELVIPLEVDENNAPLIATGELFWDDGESLLTDTYYYFTMNFAVNSDSAVLLIKREKADTTVDLPTLDLVDIFGINYSPDPSSFKLNNAPVSVTSNYNAEKKTLRIEAKGLIDWKTLASVQLSWQHSGSASAASSTIAVALTAIAAIYRLAFC
uniref:P-type domain-containing protein n=1 Tax=Ascaris lumbricoides TaxID=6252 RepID=A0A9J2P2Z6_ASCLU